MRLPSKVTTYKESVISKFPAVLKVLEKGDMTPTDLYRIHFKKSLEISEFVDVLDCLYALGKLEIDADRGTLHYVV